MQDLAADTRTKRTAMERMKLLHRAGHASYDELAEAAKAFCAAFEAYQRARYGKAKRLDYRAVIR